MHILNDFFGHPLKAFALCSALVLAVTIVISARNIGKERR